MLTNLAVCSELMSVTNKMNIITDLSTHIVVWATKPAAFWVMAAGITVRTMVIAVTGDNRSLLLFSDMVVCQLLR